MVGVDFDKVKESQESGYEVTDGGVVMPKAEFDRVLPESKGDLRIVETKLGLNQGCLSGSDTMIFLVKPENIKNIRIPSGNEGGANGQWIPGGYTNGGIAEAVMDFSHKPPANEIKLTP